MPMTMSASPSLSIACRASGARMSTSGMGRYGGVVFLYGQLELAEEIRQSGRHAVPVGDERRPQRVFQVVLGGQADGLGEGLHRHFLFVTVKVEAVDHGVGVVAGDGVFGGADVLGLDGAQGAL